MTISVVSNDETIWTWVRLPAPPPFLKGEIMNLFHLMTVCKPTPGGLSGPSNLEDNRLDSVDRLFQAFIKLEEAKMKMLDGIIDAIANCGKNFKI